LSALVDGDEDNELPLRSERVEGDRVVVAGAGAAIGEVAAGGLGVAAGGVGVGREVAAERLGLVAADAV